MAPLSLPTLVSVPARSPYYYSVEKVDFLTREQAIYLPGLVEFYFDSARTIMDLTLSQTIQNFTKILYHIPQEGGSFPSIEDRFIKSYPALETSSKEVYNTRCVTS